MNITFYNNKSNHNVVNKTLEEVNTLDFIFKDNGSLLNPNLLIKNYIGGNYCYIQELNKYYFIDNIDLVKGNLYNIHCSIDVLKTYATDIINANYYSNDGVLVVTDNEIDYNEIYDISKFLLVIGG